MAEGAAVSGAGRAPLGRARPSYLRNPLLVFIALTAIWGTVGLYLHATYRQAMETGTKSALDLALGLEESIVRGLDSVELSLLFVRDSYARDAAARTAQGRMQGAWTRAKPLTDGLILQLSVTDRQGMLVASNLGSENPMDLSDREHVRVHLLNPGDFLFVSKPVLGRNSGKWSIQFSRKLLGTDGSFEGVVVASVDPYLLSRFYNSIKTGHGSVVLVGVDGIIRARAPDPEHFIGKNLPASPELAAGAGESGVFRQFSVLDHVERMFAYRKLKDYPLIVVVGLDMEDILAGFARDRLMALLSGAAGSIFALAGGFLLNRSEQALWQSGETLSVAVQNVSQGIMLVDEDGNVPLINHHAGDMLGLPEELLAGQPSFADIVRWQQEHGEFAGSAAQMAGIVALPDIGQQPPIYERRRANGTVLEVRTTRLTSGGAVRTYTDITERTRTAEALAAARDAAEAAGRARSEFIAVTSHELRTPLNGVIGAADLLLEAQLPAAERHYVQIIRDSGQHLLELISDVLDYTKLDAQRLELEQIGFDPRQLIEQVQHSQAAHARTRGLALRIDIAPEVPEQLMGDPRRLRQVLLNLVGNEIKFTPDGFVSVALSLLERQPQTARIRIVVSDSGIGIPSEAIRNLFQEFKQADSSISRRYGRTGLGLAISQRLVGLMGGQIEVHSDASGTQFSFELCLGVSDGAHETAPAADGSTRSCRRTRLRVLLAEDNATNRLIITRMLERAGHAVAGAGNGAEALDSVQAEDFDLVLMDMMMPEMDGLAATRAIRALSGRAGRLPIIGLTANASAEDQAACLAAGMNGFATKPITSDRLQSAIEKGMDNMPESAAPIFQESHLRELAQELGAETVLEITTMFIEDSARQLQRMGRDTEDAAMALREAHALASAARNVGLMRLGEAAAALELDLRSQATPDLPLRIALLERLQHAGVDELQRWRYEATQHAAA